MLRRLPIFLKPSFQFREFHRLSFVHVMPRKGSTSPMPHFVGSAHQQPSLETLELLLIFDSSNLTSSSVETRSSPIKPVIRWSSSETDIEPTVDVNMITEGALPGNSRA